MSASPPTLRGQLGRRAAVFALIAIWIVGFTGLNLSLTRVRQAIESGAENHLDALESELILISAAVGADFAPVILPAPERFVQVLNGDGEVLAASGELAGLGPVISPNAVPVEADGSYTAEIDSVTSARDPVFVIARRIALEDQELIGIVGASLTPLSEARSGAWRLLLFGGGAVALVVGAVAWFAVRYSMTPVAQMAARADEIGQGMTHLRQLDVRPSTSELQLLVVSLDGLLGRIGTMVDNERAFLDDASHELRTPIAVARGELDLLRSELIHEPALAEAVVSSIEELDRLDRLASDLLFLARARSADQDRNSICDLSGIARRAAAAVIRASNRTDVTVRVHGEGRIVGDEQALERALINIVANAIAHCHQDVDIGLAMVDNDLVARITDDGPGFSEAALDEAFLRFPDGRDRMRGGTGLGLAIAAAIVNAHSGVISAETRSIGGAEVTLRFSGVVASSGREGHRRTGSIHT